jgi:iron-sulfur cluster assembly protein
MLTLTHNATLVAKEIETQPGRPDGATLRITTEEGSEHSYVVAAGPQQPGDQVVEQEGATVFLDARAATSLDDKVLDAAVDGSGTVEFLLAYQA